MPNSTFSCKQLDLNKFVVLLYGMDSLSQIVLGAAVGEVLLGKRLGNKAQLFGAIGGTIPDLDVLLGPLFSDEITKLQIHRGYSHALFIHLIMAYPLARWCVKHWNEGISRRRWYLFWFLAFSTHALLDCCTTYGTQLFLPFSNYLVGFNNIAVVDPLWTLPFMLLLLVCLSIQRENPRRLRWAMAACTYATVYMLLTFSNKYRVHRHFEEQLAKTEIHYHSLNTTPTMFNNLLWSGIAIAPDSIFFGEYSLLQSEQNVTWVGYPINKSIIENHPNQEAMRALQWFGQGAYFAVSTDVGVDFFTAKWGRTDFTQTEPHRAFVFHWRIDSAQNNWRAYQVMPEWGKEDFTEALNALRNRIFEAPH